MLNVSAISALSWRPLLRSLRHPLAGLVLTAGLMASGLALPGHSVESSLSAVELQPSSPSALSAIAQSHQVFPDGVYLYGQSAEPDQIGSVYAVFEVNGSQTVGAFYMPHSSFDCFRGEIRPDRMALTVRATYEQETFPYSVALTNTSSVADASGSTASPAGLEGFQRINTVSENDQRILSTCQAETR